MLESDSRIPGINPRRVIRAQPRMPHRSFGSAIIPPLWFGKPTRRITDKASSSSFGRAVALDQAVSGSDLIRDGYVEASTIAGTLAAVERVFLAVVDPARSAPCGVHVEPSRAMRRDWARELARTVIFCSAPSLLSSSLATGDRISSGERSWTAHQASSTGRRGANRQPHIGEGSGRS